MKIHFIGSGSSGNCCLIDDGKTRAMLDAGLPLPAIERGCDFSLSSVGAVLISHAHGDHVRSAKALAQLGLDVFCNEDTFDWLGGGRRFHPMKALEHYDIGTLRVTPFDVHHDIQNFGYFIESRSTRERLVYMVDTFYTDYRFPRVNYWLVECNYIRTVLDRNRAAGTLPDAVYRRVLSSHMSLDATLKMLMANDLSRTTAIYLLHLSDANSDEAAMIRAVQQATGKPTYAAPRRGKRGVD